MLIYGNRWLREYCGVPMTALPRSPLSVIVPEDRPLVLEQMTKRMRGEDALPHCTVRIPRHDGVVGHMELYAQVVNWHGRPAIQGSVVEDNPGGGSVFVFELPTAMPGGAGAEAPARA